MVVDGGRLVGILSRLDLLSLYSVHDDQLGETVLQEAVRGEFGLPEVEVSVCEGVITLEGGTARRSDILRLVHAVRRVEGVVRVRCLLDYDVDDLVLMSGKR
ncbi:BON domain-containing protein [Allosalinactinospora lopnorensis]|uniref:BON domain-containing protein n=1 Tax=Allosalinactinospora lopnorensis TaxID=1352348 RepID=UPI001F18D78F|nr:BON domain-containing protein [Allosalinactinospora lopnorensis]